MAGRIIMKKYTLFNAYEQHTKTPETFKIPNPSDLKKLTTGDLVKLIFAEEGKNSERMWVDITEADFPNFRGTLNNDPYQLKTIKFGDIVEFETKHIAVIWEE
jgi:uncharacterized protein YegJ (DUF2314 family)